MESLSWCRNGQLDVLLCASSELERHLNLACLCHAKSRSITVLSTAQAQHIAEIKITLEYIKLLSVIIPEFFRSHLVHFQTYRP
jgi:hypothetical protein